MLQRLIFIVLLVSISTCLCAQSENPDFTDSLIHTEFNLKSLEKAFNHFDTYDYVRSNTGYEELVIHLLSESERLHYSKGVAQSMNMLGVIKRDKAEYITAIELHKGALKYAEGDTLLTIFTLNNLGVANRRLDKSKAALGYHMEALKLSEKLGPRSEIGVRSTCVAYNSIGNINLALSQPNKALEMFNHSLLLERKLENDLGIAINLHNIGAAHEMNGNFEKALEFYEESLRYNEKINSMVGRSICYNSIGTIFLLQNEPINALQYFQQAMIFSENTGDNYYISQNHANIGRAYLAINKFDKAFDNIRTYNTIAKQISSSDLIKDSYELLSEYFAATGDYKLSLENYKIAVECGDSLKNVQNSRFLNELQTVYETQKREQHIHFLTMENRIKTQKYLFAVIGFSLLIVAIVVLVLLLQKRNSYRQNELEQKIFRSQMNPHFLFNALGSIQNFMYQNEARKAGEYLGKFSTLTRSVLNNSSKELVALEDELELLENYMNIEQMRLRNIFKYTINIDESVEPDFTYIPPMMLQPFVENAIHHGLKVKNSKDGFLEVKISQSSTHIIFKIEDNGVGINVGKSRIREGHESMGMKIFTERSRLLQKKYKKSIKFAAVDLNDENEQLTGTRIELEFPLLDIND